MRLSAGEGKNLVSLGICFLASLWLVMPGNITLAQESKDVYLLDLGIVIENDSLAGDTASNAVLSINKAPAGAAYVESTRELRSVLDELRSKIEVLENSLDQDVNAVRLENQRLRALIRKIQTERLESSAMAADADRASAPAPPPEIPLAGKADYRDILSAYRLGHYDRVGSLCSAIAQTELDQAQLQQVAYWCADANYRTGRYDEALAALENVTADGDDLQDDAIILRGLIFMRQGRNAEALTQFRIVIDTFPASDYLRLAELTIKELNDL
ncbi:MAG: tetratricopeptide repeat protein [Candidatus Neomarinimicrobiota bacterium]